MNDTDPEIDERFRAMLLARTGEERLIMGCAMRDTSRALVEASSSKGAGFESAMNDEPGGDSEGNGWRMDITLRWDGLRTR